MFYFQLDGKLVGVVNLTLEEERKLEIAVTATNSKIVDGVEIAYLAGEILTQLFTVTKDAFQFLTVCKTS